MDFMSFFSKNFGQIIKAPERAFNKILALGPAFAEEEEFHDVKPIYEFESNLSNKQAR